SRYTYYLERILFGVSKAVVEQAQEGEDYGKINKVYSISIVYYDFGEGEDYIYRGTTEFRGVRKGDILRISRKEELTEEELMQEQGKDADKRRQYKLKKQTIGDIFPEYCLIRINAFRPSIANALEEWMTFLKDNSINDDTTVPGLVEAKEVLKRSNMTEAELNTYVRHLEAMQNEKSATQYSYASGKVDGRAEGLAEGRAEGRAEGLAEGEHQKSIDIARKMKSANLDVDFISNMTGLSIAEIEKI
ncbi:MAG: hypothetical protein IIT83_03625, partial [Bacteroidales bacterium]|nr:hypothetical protein [Bacteroidales bacterium]